MTTPPDRRLRDRVPSSAVIRRRRAVAGAAAGLAVLAVVLLVLVGSQGGAPRYVPSGASGKLLSSGSRTLPKSGGPAFKPAPGASARVRTMPLATQVAQLFLVTVSGRTPALAAQLGAVPWGGVVFGRSNASNVREVARLARTVQARLGHLAGDAPLLGATQEGGAQSAFPFLPPKGQAALGATGDPTRAREQALLAGRRLRALGVRLTLAPLADVDTPSGALSGRLFGSDPSAVAKFTGAALSGYAGAGVIAAAGHFPGSGGASADPDQMTATVGGSLTQLETRDLIPFTAVRARTPVMLMSNAAYVAFDGVTPASLSEPAVKLLRQELHFQGVVMSDDLDATLQPTGAQPGAVALQALQAGVDLLYISGSPSEQQAALQGVLSSAQHSAATRALVHKALLRVLSLKARYGLLR
ncbi:MAG: hypothetical protein M3Z27_10280 [Actinomycetota bacterium]|nr:hypothetical protein [Actinomycetota bacterium]